MIPDTVAAASSTAGTMPAAVRTDGGFGVSFTSTPVRIPKVPSEPDHDTAQIQSDRVGGRARQESRSPRPRSPSRQRARDSPWCPPPDSADRRRCWRRCHRSCTPTARTGPERSENRGDVVRFDRSRLITPGPTQAVRFSGSMATSARPVMATTIAPSSGTAPPASPVPAPLATIAAPDARAARTTPATSSAVLGNTTRPALPRTTPASMA